MLLNKNSSSHAFGNITFVYRRKPSISGIFTLFGYMLGAGNKRQLMGIYIFTRRIYWILVADRQNCESGENVRPTSSGVYLIM